MVYQECEQTKDEGTNQEAFKKEACPKEVKTKKPTYPKHFDNKLAFCF